MKRALHLLHVKRALAGFQADLRMARDPKTWGAEYPALARALRDQYGSAPEAMAWYRETAEGFWSVGRAEHADACGFMVTVDDSPERLEWIAALLVTTHADRAVAAQERADEAAFRASPEVQSDGEW